MAVLLPSSTEGHPYARSVNGLRHVAAHLVGKFRPEHTQFRTGDRVRLIAGIERPESERGAVEVGTISALQADGMIAVYFPGAGTTLYRPSELVPEEPHGP